MKFNYGLATYYFGLDQQISRGRSVQQMALFPRAREIRKIPLITPPTEFSDSFRLSLDVSGVIPEDIAVVVEGRELIVEIEKEFDPYKVAHSNWDKCYGVFTRVFELPEGVDGTQVHCWLNRDCLEIEIFKEKFVEPYQEILNVHGSEPEIIKVPEPQTRSL